MVSQCHCFATVRTIEKVVCGMSNDARQKMGIEGRKKVEAEFSREVVIRSYLEIISSIVLSST